MIKILDLKKRIGSDETGATIVEFGIIVLPFSVLLMGAFDLGYKNYVRSVMQGTLTQAARIASTESPVFVGAIEDTTLEDRIRYQLKKKIDVISRNATYDVELKSYSEFSGLGKPEKLSNDVNQNGEFDADDNDCWEDLNDNGTYDLSGGRDNDLGGASDIVFYKVNVKMPRLFPMAGLIKGVSDEYDITVETAFRSQPFDVQEAPPIVCADD